MPPAQADRALLTMVLNGFAGAKVTLGPDDAPLDGGFMLVNAGYEKDCSFRSLLSTIRDAEETAVYQLLFD